jgi:magnesium chelatase family protein
MAAIKGHEHVERALEVAAAGGHHILLVGPGSAGQTLLAHALATMLLTPTAEQEAEISAIYHEAGLPAPTSGGVPGCPCRAPLPTVTCAALLGGGEPLRPGGVSLAHRGLLLPSSEGTPARSCSVPPARAEYEPG